MHRDENVKAHFNLDFALPSHSTHTGSIFSRFHFSYIITRAYVLSETYCLELVHHFTFDLQVTLIIDQTIDTIVTSSSPLAVTKQFDSLVRRFVQGQQI